MVCGGGGGGGDETKLALFVPGFPGCGLTPTHTLSPSLWCVGLSMHRKETFHERESGL